MGYYTEFNFRCFIKKDEMQKVTSILDETDKRVLKGNSSCFPFKGNFNMYETFGVISLQIQAQLKNYNQEIEKFLETIFEYIDCTVEEDYFLGYVKEENSLNPTLIFYDEEYIKYISLDSQV